MELQGRKVINAEIDGVDHSDYPDYCDAYFAHAVFADNGEELTDEELEELTDTYADVISTMAYEDSCGAGEDCYDMDR